jgi:hypothetical protein
MLRLARLVVVCVQKQHSDCGRSLEDYSMIPEMNLPCVNGAAFVADDRLQLEVGG